MRLHLHSHRLSFLLSAGFATCIGLAPLSGTFAGSKPSPTLYGRVAAVTLSKNQETIKGFTLLHKKVHYTYIVKAATEFIPRSASADVQGFAQKDFAYALSARGVAKAVEYDVSAFKPGPFEDINGTTVSKPSKAGLLVLLDSNGKRHRVWLTSSTSYYIDGQPQSSQIQIKKGMDLTVFAQKAKSEWQAFSIDEKT